MRRDPVRVVGESEIAPDAAEIGILGWMVEAELAGNGFGIDRRQLFLGPMLFARKRQFRPVEKCCELRGKIGAGFAVFGGDALTGNLDAAGMKFIGNGQIVERDRRPGALFLAFLRGDDQVVEQRSEIELVPGADLSLPLVTACIDAI